MGDVAQIPTSSMAVIARPQRRSMEVRLTHRWREMDSNFWYRGTKAADFRSIPGIARTSAGSARPIVRQPAIRR